MISKSTIVQKLPTVDELNIDVVLKKDNVIYAFETKGCLVFDTTNRPAQEERLEKIKIHLSQKYSNIEVKVSFFNPAWFNSTPKCWSYNDFMMFLGFPSVSYEAYLEIGRHLGNKIQDSIEYD